MMLLNEDTRKRYNDAEIYIYQTRGSSVKHIVGRADEKIHSQR